MEISSENESDIVYRINPAVTNDELNSLFAGAWENHKVADFRPILERSLAFACAYNEARLIGFVNLAWDGGVHAFLLDTTVHPDFQRCGIGRRLVEKAVTVARERGLQWLHVDFEPHLQTFYDQCGFKNTRAGLLKLK
jgi:GNAT superfamily N-acetyltransferase